MRWKYVSAFLAAVAVFASCFLVLRFWFRLQPVAAAAASALSAAGSLAGALPALVKTILEIDKLRLENRRLRREDAEAQRRVTSPTLEEIDRYGLKARPFVTDSHEEKL